MLNTKKTEDKNENKKEDNQIYIFILVFIMIVFLVLVGFYTLRGANISRLRMHTHDPSVILAAE